MYESAAGVKRIFPVLAANGGNSFPGAWRDASGRRVRCSERCYCFFSLAALLLLVFVTSQRVGMRKRSSIGSSFLLRLYPCIRRRCGMSIFVPGVAFTPRLGCWSGVSRAYPIVDEDSFGFGGR